MATNANSVSFRNSNNIYSGEQLQKIKENANSIEINNDPLSSIEEEYNIFNQKREELQKQKANEEIDEKKYKEELQKLQDAEDAKFKRDVERLNNIIDENALSEAYKKELDDAYNADNDNIPGIADLDIHSEQKDRLINNTFNNSDLDFLLPRYGVQDFINERALWQKGVHNLTGEPGWFYFKIFFDFKTPKGLFGGILTDDIPNTSAIRYLYGIRAFYKSSKIMDRMLALAKFTYTLSFINTISPWFFIGINGVNKLNSLNLLDGGKEKSIDLICNGEAVDMRLSTLLDMYKYACYDEINMKEVIPENLRKFDMSIVIMNVPIKYFQTAMMVSEQTSNLSNIGSNSQTLLNKTIDALNNVTSFLTGSSNKKFDYKTISGEDNKYNNRLSFQMYTLKNCEIDPDSFNNYLPGGINNTQFFKLGTGTIKIKYDRYYKHTFNEWKQMMYGTTGIYYDLNPPQNKSNLLAGINADKYDNKIPNTNNQRINAIRKSVYNSFFNKDTEAYKGLIDFSEAVIKDSLINVQNPYILGNIADTYDATNYEDLWNKTKEQVKSFFTF